MRRQYFVLLLLIATAIAWGGCKKYLDAKPDQSLVIPSTLTDVQALLDNTYLMNIQAPTAGEASADNYYLTNDSYHALYSLAYQNMYLWGDEINYDLFPGDWEIGYDQVYTANVVLETLASVERTPANAVAWDNVKGSALYFRSNAFLKAVYTWAPPYDSATAGTDMGVPLRLHSDFNVVSVRASVADCYRQVLSDLKVVVPLLPVTALNGMRPSRPGVYALIARAYLSMQDYTHAGMYADSCLLLNPGLMDYNTLDSNDNYPFPRFNPETLITHGGYNANLDEYTAKVDTTLLSTYAPNDLRKTLFFRPNGDGSFAFRGTYYGGYGLFTGLATDEVYLTRAECSAREGRAEAALADFVTLLKNRYKTGTYQPPLVADSDSLLTLILAERRKELPFRDLRWMDLKRLNREARYAKTLTRVVDGQTYTLPPNDPRYALPLPRSVIELTGMQQNPR